MRLTVDGQSFDIDADPAMPLLWALRDLIGKTGPKFGCGIAACGACTVHVDGQPVRSCSLPVGEVSGAITTIEGIASAGKLHPVQQAWLEEQVAQCGYCQAGQIMCATTNWSPGAGRQVPVVSRRPARPKRPIKQSRTGWRQARRVP